MRGHVWFVAATSSHSSRIRGGAPQSITGGRLCPVPRAACERLGAGRLTYGGLGPALLRSRGSGTPQFRLQESLCSNAVFVFPSATPGKSTLQGSHECVISAMSFIKSAATAPARASAGGGFVPEEDQERLLP